MNKCLGTRLIYIFYHKKIIFKFSLILWACPGGSYLWSALRQCRPCCFLLWANRPLTSTLQINCRDTDWPLMEYQQYKTIQSTFCNTIHSIFCNTIHSIFCNTIQSCQYFVPCIIIQCIYILQCGNLVIKVIPIGIVHCSSHIPCCISLKI